MKRKVRPVVKEDLSALRLHPDIMALIGNICEDVKEDLKDNQTAAAISPVSIEESYVSLDFSDPACLDVMLGVIEEIIVGLRNQSWWTMLSPSDQTKNIVLMVDTVFYVFKPDIKGTGGAKDKGKTMEIKNFIESGVAGSNVAADGRRGEMIIDYDNPYAVEMTLGITISILEIIRSSNWWQNMTVEDKRSNVGLIIGRIVASFIAGYEELYPTTVQI